MCEINIQNGDNIYIKSNIGDLKIERYNKGFIFVLAKVIKDGEEILEIKLSRINPSYFKIIKNNLGYEFKRIRNGFFYSSFLINKDLIKIKDFPINMYITKKINSKVYLNNDLVGISTPKNKLSLKRFKFILKFLEKNLDSEKKFNIILAYSIDNILFNEN